MKIVYHVKDNENNRKYLKLWFKVWIGFIILSLIITSLYCIYVYSVMNKTINEYKTEPIIEEIDTTTSASEEIDTTTSASQLTECTYSYNGQKVCR